MPQRDIAPNDPVQRAVIAFQQLEAACLELEELEPKHIELVAFTLDGQPIGLMNQGQRLMAKIYGVLQRQSKYRRDQEEARRSLMDWAG